MPPTKNKGTRYQPKALYFCAGALLLLSAVANFGEQFAADAFMQMNDYVAGVSPIHWRNRTDALAEAALKHKPILYVALIKGDFYSARLQGEGLHDAGVAELINKNYIPVKLTSTEFRYGKKQKGDWQAVQDNGFNMSSGSLITVPWQMTDMNCNDVVSTSNLTELGVDDSQELERGNRWSCNGYSSHNYQHNRGQFGELNGFGGRAIFTGYSNHQDLMDYLQSAYLWHQLPASKGKVAWLPVETLNQPLSSKPRLIALVDNLGSNSDNMRLDIFWKDNIYTKINKSFEPVLVEFRHGDPDYNKKFDYLKERYGITSLPALVIEGAKLKAPLVQFGSSGQNATDDFLQSALTGQNSHNLRSMKRNFNGAHFSPYHH